jgi:hypothetical protein
MDLFLLDLFYLPLNLDNNLESTPLPGLLVLPAPRHANRQRETEILVVLLTPSDPILLPFNELDKILQKSAAIYFRTPGSVTASLRAVTDQLNETLLKLSREGRANEQKFSAALNIAVLKRDILFHIQSGPVITLVLGREQNPDPSENQNLAHGLGLGKTFDPCLRQSKVQPGDILVFYVNPPQNLSSFFPQNGSRISLEQLRRNLAKGTNGKVQALIAQFKPGKGEAHLLKARIPLGESTQEHLFSSDSPPEQQENDFDTSQPDTPEMETLENEKQPAALIGAQPDQAKPIAHMAKMPQLKPSWQERIMGIFMGYPYFELRRQERMKRALSPNFLRESQVEAKRIGTQPDGQRVQPEEPVPQVDIPMAEQQMASTHGDMLETKPAGAQTVGTVRFRQRLAILWRGGRNAQNRIGQSGGLLLTQMLPDNPAQSTPLTPAMMLFIAVAVPLILISIAATIYFREGPGKQHQLLVGQAQALVIEASLSTDPVMQRSALIQSLALLDKAEGYIITDASRALRSEGQQALDSADGVLRINFEPLSDVMDGSANITRIQTNTTETYLLDGNSGSIIRLFSSEQKFVLDRNFKCGPGQLGLASIGPLVDMVVLPPGNPNKATVMGVDADGNLLYCIPGNPPLSNVLPPPDVNWGKIGGLFLEEGVLYVMDTANNAVYIYRGENNVYLNPPRQFFDNTVPNMPNVIDFEIRGEDLFLLHDDGIMTKCTFRTIDLIQTRCTDPMQYTDNRYGKTEQLLRFPAVRFIQLVATLPPEPSIYILDSNASSIYHFGLSLTLYDQIQMQVYTNFSKPKRLVTAFAVSSGKRVWMAFGNQVFFGRLP